MNPVGIWIHEQQDAVVAAGSHLEPRAATATNCIGERLEERMARHLLVACLQGVERLALHRQYGLKRRVANPAHRIGSRVALHEEQFAARPTAVGLAVVELERSPRKVHGV